MLGFKLNHVSKSGPCTISSDLDINTIQIIWQALTYTRYFNSADSRRLGALLSPAHIRTYVCSYSSMSSSLLSKNYPWYRSQPALLFRLMAEECTSRDQWVFITLPARNFIEIELWLSFYKHGWSNSLNIWSINVRILLCIVNELIGLKKKQSQVYTKMIFNKLFLSWDVHIIWYT